MTSNHIVLLISNTKYLIEDWLNLFNTSEYKIEKFGINLIIIKNESVHIRLFYYDQNDALKLVANHTKEYRLPTIIFLSPEDDINNFKNWEPLLTDLKKLKIYYRFYKNLYSFTGLDLIEFNNIYGKHMIGISDQYNMLEPLNWIIQKKY